MKEKKYLDGPPEELTREGIEKEIRAKFGSLNRFLQAVNWAPNKYYRLFNGRFKHVHKDKPAPDERIKNLVTLIKKTRKNSITSDAVGDDLRNKIREKLKQDKKTFAAIERENSLPDRFIYNILNKRIVRSPYLSVLLKALNIEK